MEEVGLPDPNSFSPRTACSARNPWRAMLFLGLAIVVACVASSTAYGDVGVVLNESLDTSVARITGSGHSAVYFSRICPASPVKLRLCLPGEQGSVMSNYTTLGEDQPFEWNVVSLNVYLYGVENPRYRPIVGSQKDQARAGRTIPRELPGRLLRQRVLPDQQQGGVARDGGRHALAQPVHFRGGHNRRAGPSR